MSNSNKDMTKNFLKKTYFVLFILQRLKGILLFLPKFFTITMRRLSIIVS